MVEVTLRGCTPEPLMSYLKALGILRLVGEQADPRARGFWRDDVFVLRSELDEAGLEEFFLRRYRPTPIVGPWAGGSGFFTKDNKAAVEALVASATERLGAYRDVIGQVRSIIREEGIKDKPADEDKARLIRRYRNELPDEVVAWMDAVMALQQERQEFAPILGTGGNDGRLDFTQNFMQRIVLLALEREEPASESVAWLRHALHDTPAMLSSGSIGQFAPGRAGGPNATQGMERESIDNPWDFVLMIEGSLVLAGAAVRRLGVTGDSRAAFPFTVRGADVAFASAASGESSESRGEVWLPVWERACTPAEIRAIFGEGRADIEGKRAGDAVSFARAVSMLGVDRGISAFTRVSLLRRSGKSFLATPIGRILVAERPHADLITDIDEWLGAFRHACSGDRVPPRFKAALRRIDTAIIDYCIYGGALHFRSIIAALGYAERELARGKRFREEKRLSPLDGLSIEWIEAARPAGGPEAHCFEIALALAGMGREILSSDAGSEGASIRCNLEPVEWRRGRHVWTDRESAVVWNSADLSANLAAVLVRRVMAGERGGGVPRFLDHARATGGASPGAIGAFLRRELDGRMIEDLLWGLMLVKLQGKQLYSPGETALKGQVEQLPPVYCLLKLLFLQGNLRVRFAGKKAEWHLTGPEEDGSIPLRPEPAILPLLRTGRVGDAARIAMRRLRASGFAPLPHRRSGGPDRDDAWREVRMTPSEGARLAAALLIPIDGGAVNMLVQRATRADEGHHLDEISK